VFCARWSHDPRFPEQRSQKKKMTLEAKTNCDFFVPLEYAGTSNERSYRSSGLNNMVVPIQ
jgi:hypothetical protein